MTDSIQISFGPSRSPHMAELGRIAATFWNYRERKGTHTITFAGKELIKNWENFNLIFHTAKAWNNFHLWVNDRELHPVEYSKFFYGLQDMKNCYKNMPKYKPLKECHNSDWGCKWIELPHYHPQGGAGFFWYHCGELKDGKWIIDKEQIRSIIEEQVKEKGLDFCPLFDRAFVHQRVDDLPDEIDLKDNPEYEIIYEKKFVGVKLTSVPTGIRHKEVDPEPRWLDDL